MSERRLLIIGLDGASWELLGLLMESEELPNLKKLKENGTYGISKSTMPPVSAPAWTSFATGKNPGKHGCFDFLYNDTSLRRTRVVSSLDVKGPTFYELLDMKGFRSILINLPLSRSPLVKNAILIGSITSGASEKVYPDTIVDRIPSLKGYRTVPKVSLAKRGNMTDYINDVRKLEEDRFSIAKCLFSESWDFFFILFSGTDFIQHYLYHELMELENESEAIKFYRDLDIYIGWFMENISSETNLFVISDHGFRCCKGKFHINEWLRREGLLSITKASRERIFPHEFAREGFKEFGLKFQLPLLLLKNAHRLRSLYALYKKAKKFVALEADAAFQVIPEKTSACCISNDSWGIFLNEEKRFVDGILDVSEYRVLRQMLIEILPHIKDDAGEKIFADVLKKEDVYWGSEVDKKAPDLILIPNNYSVSKDLSPSVISYGICSDHSVDGMFIASGRNVLKGEGIGDVKIWDMAPTILHIFDLPVPIDMDGKVLTEIFRERSEPVKKDAMYDAKRSQIQLKQIKQKLSAKDEEELKKRLKSLGYL